MARSKCYDVTLTATITRSFTIVAYDSEEAIEKAMDRFGTGRIEDYDIDDIDVFDVDETAN